MFDFKCGFELEQVMIWGMIGWTLRDHWLRTSMRSMLDYQIIRKMKKKERNGKRNWKANQDRVFESWKALND